MKPFFSYYGSKYRMARKYPRPGKLVIEPFAGSACYSVYWEPEKVILYDLNPTIVSLWKFLINATPSDIMDLPLDFDEIPLYLPKGARNLIGFCLGRGHTYPVKHKSSAWSHYTSIWCAVVRERISRQVAKIKNWEIYEASYETAPDVEATWFIDPPYKEKGYKYKFHNIDYPKLATWCQTRPGLVIACEADGADWLPFKFLSSNRGARMDNREAVWLGFRTRYSTLIPRFPVPPWPPEELKKNGLADC